MRLLRFCFFTIIFIVIHASPVFTQEDCTNGIDDDGNGLIDLNDESCICRELVTEIHKTKFTMGCESKLNSQRAVNSNPVHKKP